MRWVGAGLADKLSFSQIARLQNPRLQTLIYRNFA